MTERQENLPLGGRRGGKQCVCVCVFSRQRKCRKLLKVLKLLKQYHLHNVLPYSFSRLFSDNSQQLICFESRQLVFCSFGLILATVNFTTKFVESNKAWTTGHKSQEAWLGLESEFLHLPLNCYYFPVFCWEHCVAKALFQFDIIVNCLTWTTR